MKACRWFVLVALVGLVMPATAAGTDGETLFDSELYKPLVAEEKAFRVGDVLTVIVQESASATSAADSRARRTAGLTAQASTNRVGPLSVTGSFGTDNDGGGRTQRSGRLLATLSVRITELAANGDLVVRGEQRLSINEEDQTITLTGVVRPRDIGDNNTVASSRIADARITFNGEGFVAEKSKPGWVSRLLTFLGF
jgi:flagellar L-ring protein FlgH